MQVFQSSRMSRRWIRHHLPLFVLTTMLTTLLYVTRPYKDVLSRASFATAYPALLLVACTLTLGAWRLVRAHQVPVSFDLRRDVGIWAGVISVLHAAIGQMVHLRGRPWLYYVYPRENHQAFLLRHDLFGSANETGLVATLLVIALLATSNDASLRRMGTSRWKRLQRWNYAVLALAGVHTMLYLQLEKQLASRWALMAALFLTITLTIQLAGFTVRKRRPGTKTVSQ